MKTRHLGSSPPRLRTHFVRQTTILFVLQLITLSALFSDDDGHAEATTFSGEVELEGDYMDMPVHEDNEGRPDRCDVRTMGKVRIHYG